MEAEKERIRSAYDDFARQFDRMGAIGEALGLRRLRRELLRHARGRVLEVGIGTGASLSGYSADCELTGVDLSASMLDRARRRARRQGRTLALAVMDAEHLAFADASFDTVVDTLAVCTYPDPVGALREMGRVCKPSGLILLLEHGRSDRPRLGGWQDRHSPRIAKRLGCHWNREPHELAAQAGLEVLRHERHLLGAVHLIAARPGARG